MSTGMKTLILTLLSNRAEWGCYNLAAAAVGTPNRIERLQMFFRSIGELVEEKKIITSEKVRHEGNWERHTIRRPSQRRTPFIVRRRQQPRRKNEDPS